MTVVVDDLIKTLKNRIIIAYSNYVLKLQKGYPLSDQKKIKDAIMALEYIEDYELSPYIELQILEQHILRLS